MKFYFYDLDEPSRNIVTDVLKQYCVPFKQTSEVTRGFFSSTCTYKICIDVELDIYEFLRHQVELAKNAELERLLNCNKLEDMLKTTYTDNVHTELESSDKVETKKSTKNPLQDELKEKLSNTGSLIPPSLLNILDGLANKLGFEDEPEDTRITESVVPFNELPNEVQEKIKSSAPEIINTHVFKLKITEHTCGESCSVIAIPKSDFKEDKDEPDIR